MKNQLQNLRKEVNQLDKKYGVKLNKTEFFKQPQGNFFIASMTYRDYLYDIIKELNQLEFPFSKEITMTRDIARLSKLGWDKTDRYDVDSLQYRSRFLTLLLVSIAENIDTLCEREFMYHSPGVGIYEQQYFYLLEIDKDLKRFVQLFLEGNDWRNLVIKVLEYTALLGCKKKKKAQSLIDGSRHYIHEIRTGMERNGAFGGRLLEDSLILDQLFKWIVLICGNTGYNNAVPAYVSFKNKIPGNDDYRYEIAYLGKSIMCAHDTYRETGLLYQIFMDASPYLEYSFPNINENPYLNTGANALEFARFVINDKRVSKLIDKVLMKPGWIW